MDWLGDRRIRRTPKQIPIQTSLESGIPRELPKTKRSGKPQVVSKIFTELVLRKGPSEGGRIFPNQLIRRRLTKKRKPVTFGSRRAAFSPPVESKWGEFGCDSVLG